MTEVKLFSLEAEARKVLDNACKHRDRMYRLEYKEWKKIMKMFERAAFLLKQSGDTSYLNLIKPFIKMCRRRVESSPFHRADRSRAKKTRKS
jgi:hypothetical protein